MFLSIWDGCVSMGYQVFNDGIIKEKVYRHLGENSFLPVLWISDTGLIFYANNAALEFLGYGFNEITNLKVSDIDTMHSTEDFLETFNLLTSKKIIEIDTQHRKKNGDLVDVEVIANYFNIDDTEFIIVYLIDITERKLKKKELQNIVDDRTKELNRKVKKLEVIEKKLRSTHDFLMSAFKNSQDAISVASFDTGVFLQANESLCILTGYTEEEIIGHSSFELNLWKKPEDRKAITDEIKKKGFCKDFESETVCKNGEIKNTLMSASLQEFNGQNVLFMIVKDITKIKNYEKQLQEMNLDLKNQVEKEVEKVRIRENIIEQQKKIVDMSEMMTAVAHHWRQPLSALATYIQEVSDCYDNNELDKEYIDFFTKKCMGLIVSMSDVVDEFKMFLKPDVKKESFAVVNKLIEVINIFKSLLKSKNIHYYYSHKDQSVNDSKDIVAPDCNYDLVFGYESEFKQCLVNILSNSIYFIDERLKKNEITEGKIFINFSKTSDYLNLKISDNGGGFKAGTINKVFNPFYTTKEEGEGVGLGLYFMRILIDKHMHGKVSAYNDENGAVIDISLPAFID